MTLCCLDTLAARYHNRYATILYLLAERILNLLHILGQRHNYANMVGVYAQATAYILNLTRTCRVLTSGHTRGEVIRDDDNDVGVRVYAVQQTCHTRVGERRVADNCKRGELTSIRSTLGHGDRGTHLHAGINSVEGRQCSKCVAADIAEDAGIFVLGSNLVQCLVHVAVAVPQPSRRRRDAPKPPCPTIDVRCRG